MAGQYLQDLFGSLTDEAIVARIQSGLDPDAYEVACRELRSRGIEPPPIAQEPGTPAEAPPYLGDMVILARDLNSTEAQMLASFLNSAGIYAEPGDVDTTRSSSLWSIAFGGAKIRVPQAQLAQAQQVLAAFNRGEFALDDDSEATR